MKRKIFSKLLMGAFLIASISSFVSCKDYDDDIKSINDKLATVALQTTVDNIQTQLQSAISAAAAAQKTADQAVAAAAAAQKTADAAATKDALALVDAAAKAAGEEAAKAIANAATAQTAAEAAQATADQAAAAAKAAQEAADAAAAAATAGSDAAKADAAAAAAAAAAAQKTADAAAEAAAKAASENKSATDAAAAVAAAAKEAADKASSETAALASQIAAAQSAAEAAQKAADTALELAKAASGKEVDLSNYVTKDALAAALKEYAKATNDYATNTTLKEEIKKVQDQIDAINNKIEGVDFAKVQKIVDNYDSSIKAIYSAVTGISLYAVLTPDDNDLQADLDFDFTLVKGRILKDKNHFTTQKLNSVTAATTSGNPQKDGTFGKNDYFNNAAYHANQTVTFKDGDYFEFPSQIVVRVSPTNAELNAANLKFIDSQGNDINNMIKVTSVAPYGGVLTRASSNSGLWVVRFALTGGRDRNDMFGATQYYGADKRFALAVGNTSDAANRNVVSEYNVLFSDVSRYIGYESLNNVKLSTNTRYNNGTAITAVTNRVLGGTANVNEGNVNDYSWDNEASVDNNVTADAARATQPYTVSNGTTIYVKFDAFTTTTAWNAATGTLETKTRPHYAYIVRDDKNANLTNDASEINAWNGYQYEGLNVLYDLEQGYPHFKVTIPAGSVTGDEIAFRLFAVNYDGTLVDPDGISFNVFVGSNTNRYTATHTFTATQALGQVVYVPFDGSKIKSHSGAATINTPTFGRSDNWFAHTAQKIEFVTKNSGNPGTNTTTDWSKVKYARVILGNTAGTSELCYWADNANAAYTFALSSGDSKNTPDFYITIDLTKTLPTAEDVKKLYSWKEGQLAGNVWTAVIYPETAVNAADASVTAPWLAPATGILGWGYKGMNNGINYLVENDGSAYVSQNFVFSFANSLYNANSKDYTDVKHIPGYDAVGNVLPVPANIPLVTNDVDGDGVIDFVDGYILNLQDGANKKLSALIDYKTQHASTIGYNYGQISSNDAWGLGDVNGGWYATYRDYVVVGENFQTIYACPFEDKTITVTCSDYKDGVKLNTVGNKVAVGDQPWNFVYYNDPTIGKGVYVANNYGGVAANTGKTFDELAIDLGTIVTTDSKWLKVSSKLGAEFVVPTLTDYISHLSSIDPSKTVFISNGTKTQDYFTVDATALPNLKLVRISGTQDPKKNIASTLRIVGKCAFGHEHKIEIPFQVKTTAE